MTATVQKQVLIKARALITDWAHWTSGMLACAANGRPVHWHDPSAHRWCAVGAIYRAAFDPDVKSFGKMLVDDHSAANERARSVAQQVGTTPPRRPSLKQRLSYGYYAALRGATFDRQFITHMVRDHKKDIQEFRTEAQSGTGHAADFAKETLPTLEKHLSTAQELQPKVTAERR